MKLRMRKSKEWMVRRDVSVAVRFRLRQSSKCELESVQHYCTLTEGSVCDVHFVTEVYIARNKALKKLLFLFKSFATMLLM